MDPDTEDVCTFCGRERPDVVVVFPDGLPSGRTVLDAPGRRFACPPCARNYDRPRPARLRRSRDW